MAMDPASMTNKQLGRRAVLQGRAENTIADNPYLNRKQENRLVKLQAMNPDTMKKKQLNRLDKLTSLSESTAPNPTNGFSNILGSVMSSGSVFNKKKKKNDSSGTLNPINYSYGYDPIEGFVKLAGGGGIGGLSEASSVPTASRFIRGPGDGVSDSIPATINGQQPAALSNNEFVVDAMTMAKLGNGSPEAGAQKMYSWQQKVHSLPTAPGKNLQAEKYLPS